MAQRIGEDHDRAVDGDEFTDADPALLGQLHAVPDDGDQQQAGQQHLDRRDQRPHPGAAHGRVPDLLGGAAVAVEEQFLTADAAQYTQPGDGVRGEFGGVARLLALVVGAAGGAGEERQDRHGEDGQADGDDDAEGRLVDDQADADQHDRDGRRREAGHGFHEPADLLDVARGDGHDLAGRDPPGQPGAQLRGLAGQELLDAGGGGDPVGDGGAVQEGVADGVAGARQGHQPAREREPRAGAVDHGLDGEADAERQRGDRHEVHQPPRPARRVGRATGSGPATTGIAAPNARPAHRGRDTEGRESAWCPSGSCSGVRWVTTKGRVAARCRQAGPLVGNEP
ncbi:hypothetical protein GCM10020295_10350 [Streptomyces cinereospinus]